MKRLLFDLESNGLWPEVDRIHCIVTLDLDTGESQSFYDDTRIKHESRKGTLQDGVKELRAASELWGHNILSYDIPVLNKILDAKFNPFFDGQKLRDTLVCSQHMWLELKLKDFAYRKINTEFPGPLVGSHSLEAWGWRLGNHKGTFGKDADWSKFTLEMLTYALQDLSTNKSLIDLILSKNYSEAALENEMRFQWVIWLQEQHGFRFDRKAAVSLYGELSEKRTLIEREIQAGFPGWYEDTKTPEYYTLSHMGEVVGKYPTKGLAEQDRKVRKLKTSLCEFTAGPLKQKHTPFNPGSRDHIAKFLIEKYGWKPRQFGEDGKPTVDEEVLTALKYPEIPKITEYLMIEKRIGQLAEGEKAWLKLEKDGRMHGEVDGNGAVSTRVTHKRPNMSQTPAIDKPYGKECRALFVADEGHVLVGADASGIQLRALAHYQYDWDSGSYVEILLKGDIHTAHKDAAGGFIKTRDDAKTFIYAYILGAQANKVASITGNTRANGQNLMDNFEKKFPALAALKAAVEERVTRLGYLTGLDGRILPTRSKHAALSSLLQGFEAAVMKRATWITHETLIGRGYIHGRDFAQVGFFHDELQITCRPDLGDEIGKTVVAAIEQAGREFNSMCPLTGAYRVGANWRDTH
jgi:hypothetical protein